MEKIAVIGSNSFTGSHFVNTILEKTDHDVIGISRSPEYNKIFLPYSYKKEKSKKFCFHQLDINKDLSKIMKLFDKKQPKAIPIQRGTASHSGNLLRLRPGRTIFLFSRAGVRPPD